METTTREALLTLYQQTLGRTIDAKTLSYWTNLITKGEKQVEEFESMIIAEPDYTERMRQIFTAAFREAVGYDFDFPKNDFRVFLAREMSHRVPTYGDVIHWIKTNSADYTSKYESIINVTYNIHTDSDCTPDIIKFYIHKFRHQDDYSLQSLETDIKQKAHLIPSNQIETHVTQNSNAQKQSWNDLLANEFEDSSIKAMIADLDATSLLDMLRPKDEIKKTEINIDEDALIVYEKVFQRPMYVKEYFKYVLEVDEPLEESALVALKEKQIKDYNILYGLYKNFNDVELSEWKFVNEHLYDIDDPKFFDTFVDAIVYSLEYKMSMVDVLNASNKQLYDTMLDENDIDYVFKKVQILKLGLNDERVTDVLKSLKNETDLFVEHISDTYKNTLERQPDVYEIAKYVEMYRRDGPTLGIDTVDDELAKILINELEFHDIIKKHIATVHVEKKGGDILRSKLFEVLNKILQRLNMVTMKSLDEMISQCI